MKNKFRFIVLLVIAYMVLLANNNVHAQKRKQLENKRGESLKKIEETNRILKQTSQQKKATISQLNLLTQKIKVQENLIENMNEEIEEIDDDIQTAEVTIASLEQDLARLKKEYATMVQLAYRYSNNFDQLAYVFSAENFRQMVHRYLYFKQYSEKRLAQAAQIKQVTLKIKQEHDQQVGNKIEKLTIAQQKLIEAENLNKDKEQQSIIVKELSSKEKQLRKELDDYKKSVLKLDNLIKDLIEEERRKAIEAARREEAERLAAENAKNKTNTTSTKSTTKTKSSSTTSKSGTSDLKNLSTNAKLSANFESNKGNLPWPVSKGRVSQHFGKQAHPVLKGVVVENLGIDILTVQNEKVRSVFGGKVLTVAQVPGMNNVVMIQHGEYFTIYAKLKTVFVKTGQVIDRNTILGEVYTDKDNTTELQFQIWKNEIKLNPESWLLSK